MYNDSRVPVALEYWKDKSVCNKCRMICEKVSYGPNPAIDDVWVKFDVCPKCKDIINTPFKDGEHTLVQSMMHALLEK